MVLTLRALNVNLNLSHEATTSPTERVSFFAVYDGHGGMCVHN